MVCLVLVVLFLPMSGLRVKERVVRLEGEGTGMEERRHLLWLHGNWGKLIDADRVRCCTINSVTIRKEQCASLLLGLFPSGGFPLGFGRSQSHADDPGPLDPSSRHKPQTLYILTFHFRLAWRPIPFLSSR
jgi:hypothetical protein